MNIVLFRSSVFSCYIHMIGLTYYENINDNYLLLVLYSGLFGSIANHYFTNEYIKYSDRIIMHLAFYYDTYILLFNNEIIHFLLLLSCVFLYISSKFINQKYSTFPHLLSHLILIVVHFRIISLFGK